MIKKVIILFLFLFVLLFNNSTIKATSFSDRFTLDDSAQVSLITCSPWTSEVYAMFGHSAIRVKDDLKNIDLVFNYGIFDFNSPNFMYRFVKGETDYIVEAVPFPYFIYEYQNRGGGVRQQDLNITTAEKQAIFDALLENCKPENRTYRYNFFFDNCATRPRNIIQKSVNGKIHYVPTNKIQSFRDLVHQCVYVNPWFEFGIDLVIGGGADKIINDRQKDFLPAYLMHAVENGFIIRADGSQQAFVKKSFNLLTPTKANPLFSFGKDKSQFYAPEFAQARPTNWPSVIGIISLLVVLSISILLYSKNKITLSKILDTIIYIIFGLGGCLLAFLMFFSVHPCTHPNWNFVWMNPFELIAALLFFVKIISKWLYYYHFLNFVVLIAFLICWAIVPQNLEAAFVPYILIILVRSGFNCLQYRRMRKPICKN